jgi:hypothetical protein
MFEIERAADGASRPKHKPRLRWPWKEMKPGDVVKISDPDMAPKAQVNCHVYGRTAGMRFSTRTINGVLHVERVE